jgi:ubiquinone/menaquinone biosynthesis C-methylase UbiE
MSREVVWALKNNSPLPLAEELVPLVGDKKKVRIADIGSGPYSIIGRLLDGVEIEVYPSDRHSFGAFWSEKVKTVPTYPIEVQDMEKLTYEDNFFDIVVCNNALDHTYTPVSAVKEMIRVVKPGGWVYINCFLDQQLTGYKHHWNAKEDGEFVSGGNERFHLKDLGFSIKYIDNNKGERRHNQIIATYQKPI